MLKGKRASESNVIGIWPKAGILSSQAAESLGGVQTGEKQRQGSEWGAEMKCKTKWGTDLMAQYGYEGSNLVANREIIEDHEIEFPSSPGLDLIVEVESSIDS